MDPEIRELLREFGHRMLEKIAEASRRGDLEEAERLSRIFRETWDKVFGREGESGYEEEGRSGYDDDEWDHPVQRAIKALRLAKSIMRKASLRDNPEYFLSLAGDLKSDMLNLIPQAIDLCEKFKASVSDVEIMAEGATEQEAIARGQDEKKALIGSAGQAKKILEAAMEKLRSEGMPKLDERLDYFFRFWTKFDGGANFASPVSKFVSNYVVDEAKAAELRNIAQELTSALIGVGFLYARYKAYLRKYESMIQSQSKEEEYGR